MKPIILALDIGATKTVIGQVRGERVQLERRFVTSGLFRRGGDIAPLISELHKLWKPQAQGLAIGFAGAVAHGYVISAPNFAVDVIPRRFPLGQLLADEFNVPVSVRNDAECFTMGEAAYGAGRHKQRVAGLTLGTGVGGGIVINGEVYRGAHGLAGEFGHLPFPSAVAQCGCGEPGHLESILSGAGLSHFYALASGHEGTSEAVVRAARRGDIAARDSIGVIEEVLVHLLLTVLIAWDPDIIVVGGGIAKIPKLLVSARRLVRARAPFAALKRVPIVPSLLHDQAVLLGAVSLAEFSMNKSR